MYPEDVEFRGLPDTIICHTNAKTNFVVFNRSYRERDISYFLKILRGAERHGLDVVIEESNGRIRRRYQFNP